MIKELASRLMANAQTLSVAESLTGGRIQARLTSVSGASQFFRGGTTTYDIDAKVRLLGVDREHAESCNCVSAQVAEEMARGACSLFDSELAIATTGYAEPAIEENVSVPFALVAVCRRQEGGDEVVCKRFEASGHREEVQDAVVKFALELLWEVIDE